MPVGKGQQCAVVCLPSSVKHDADVHHDVDEVGVRAVEGTEATGAFIESECESLTRMDHNVIDRLIGIAVTHSSLVPASICTMIKDEAEIVDLAIVFARLKRCRIGF